MDSTDHLTRALAGHGWQARAVPIDRLADLRDAIEGAEQRPHLDDQFFADRLGFFRFSPPAELGAARSIVVVAVPAPRVRVRFHWRGESRPVIVPPTYVDYDLVRRRVETAVAELLAPAGLRSARALLPQKTLAAQSGLGTYGRNNLIYVEGMGSLAQLAAVYTELPCTGDPWREPAMLDRCASCTACRKLCPTGAIRDDRFLVHAERCLTLYNERPQPWPAWIAPDWHDSLIGCLRCQRPCPANQPVWDRVEERGEFPAAETRLLLAATSLAELPAAVREKVERLTLVEDFACLPRNLAALFRSRDRS